MKTKTQHPASLAAASCSVELTSRQVIERKLLMALEDGGTVAILASKQDLEDLILALEFNTVYGPRRVRCKNLEDGMRQLLSEAFPPNACVSDPAPKDL